MTVHSDDEWFDPTEVDPRWEVQPEPYSDDASGTGGRAALTAALALAGLVVLLVWFAGA